MQPYPYQADCLSALATARQGGSKRDLVVMATGLGKTMVAAFDIKRLLEEAPGRVLYLCHRTPILAQARRTFEQVLGRGFSFGNFHGAEKHLDEVDVLFASFQTMVDWREAFLRDEFRYVVVDEVHHAQAKTFRPTVQYFTPDFMLGLTATLERTDGLDVGELFNGDPIFDLNLYEALARRYLCDVDYRIMTDEIQAEGALDTPVGRLSIAHLNRTIFIPKRDEEIARIIVEKVASIQNPRMMVFCKSTQHAENMAALIPGAQYIHWDVKAREQSGRLAAFRSGALTTITTIDMFNEGIDVPEVNVIVFLRSTVSEMIYRQQLGRGLRKTDDKDNVLVLDFVANCERIEKARELEQHVRQYREKIAQEVLVTEGSELRDPFVLALDGVEFDERAWELLGVIQRIRAEGGYTREKLVEQLQDKAKVLKRPPRANDVRADPAMASLRTFYTVFTSFNEALEAAGLTVEQRKRYFSSGQLIEQLQHKARRLERSPTVDEVSTDSEMASPSAFSRAFGSYNEALEAADLTVTSRSHRYTREELIEQLRRKAEVLTRAPRSNEVLADAQMAHPNSFAKTFGSFTKALEAAGLTVTSRPRRYTREELIEQIQTKAKELGRTPRFRDISNDPELASGDAFKRLFGTFNSALEAAGFEPNMRHSRYPSSRKE